MQGGVPQWFCSFCPHLALNPKSIILTQSSPSTRMFSSFMSRWLMPFSWQQWMPSTICLKMRLARGQGSLLVFLSSPARESCPPCCMMSSSLRLSLTTCSRPTMLGCERLCRWLIYLQMLSNLQFYIWSTFTQVLMAQRWLVCLWTARVTTEKQPLPRCESILQSSRMVGSLRYLEMLNSRILNQSCRAFRAGLISMRGGGFFSGPTLVERKRLYFYCEFYRFLLVLCRAIFFRYCSRMFSMSLLLRSFVFNEQMSRRSVMCLRLWLERRADLGYLHIFLLCQRIWGAGTL